MTKRSTVCKGGKPVVKEVIVGARVNEADRVRFIAICKEAGVSPSVMIRALVYCVNDHGFGPGSYHIGAVMRNLIGDTSAQKGAERAKFDERTKGSRDGVPPVSGQ